MTWFAHRCWYCGLKSREVDHIQAGYYQCIFENREACQQRLWEKYRWDPIGMHVEPPAPPAAQEGER